MSFWNILSNAAHKAMDTVKSEVKKVEKVVIVAEKKVEATIKNADLPKILRETQAVVEVVGDASIRLGKVVIPILKEGAKEAEKLGGEALQVAHDGLDFVEEHADTIKAVVDVTATIVESIGVATGQPEIVAAAALLKVGADKALDLAKKARKVTNTIDKAVLVGKAIREKEKVGSVINKIGDTMMTGAQINNNKKLMELAKHVKAGGHVIDSAIQHSKDLHGAVTEILDAIERRDLGGIVKGGKRGFQAGKGLVSERQQLLNILTKLSGAMEDRAEEELLEEEGKRSKKPSRVSRTTTRAPRPAKAPKAKKAPKAPKAPRVSKPKKAPKEKKGKKKRAPSKYNLFVGAHIKGGGTFKSAVAAWNAQK